MERFVRSQTRLKYLEIGLGFKPRANVLGLLLLEPVRVRVRDRVGLGLRASNPDIW